MKIPTLAQLQAINHPLLKSEVLRLYDVSKSTLERRINDGSFPAGMTLLDKRRQFWPKEVLIEHFKRNQNKVQVSYRANQVVQQTVQQGQA